jgi:hypothetical protein
MKVAFPWDDVAELIDVLEAAGATPEEAVEAAARWLMDEIDWAKVIRGPVGVFLEAADDKAIGVAKVLIKLVLRSKGFRKRREAATVALGN